MVRTFGGRKSVEMLHSTGNFPASGTNYYSVDKRGGRNS